MAHDALHCNGRCSPLPSRRPPPQQPLSAISVTMQNEEVRTSYLFINSSHSLSYSFLPLQAMSITSATVIILAFVSPRNGLERPPNETQNRGTRDTGRSCQHRRIRKNRGRDLHQRTNVGGRVGCLKNAIMTVVEDEGMTIVGSEGEKRSQSPLGL